MKSIKFLLIFVILFASIFLVSAYHCGECECYDESCTPDAGYSYCASFKVVCGDAIAHPKVEISNILGNYKGGFYVGDAKIKAKFTGDKFYVSKNVGDAQSYLDNHCDSNGCDFNVWTSSSQNVWEYDLTNQYTNQYTDCPIFYSWDRDDEGNAYAFGTIEYGWDGSGNCFDIKSVECFDNSDCGGNMICDNSGDWTTWHCEQQVCSEGEKSCSGNFLQECRNNDWFILGNVPGTCCDEKKTLEIIDSECGLGCFSDQQCNVLVGEENGYINDSYCKNGDVYRKYRTYSCDNNLCSRNDTEKLVENCSQNQFCSNSTCVDIPDNSSSEELIWEKVFFTWNGIKFTLPILIGAFGALAFFLRILRGR